MDAKPPSRAAWVLAGGFLAGAIDITYAWVFWALKAGTPLSRIFQSVAAGVLGRASFQGGAASAALGLGLHFFIATSMSVTYFLVARRLPVLVRRAVACGLAYGALLYVIMRFVVVPLSRATPGGLDPLWVTLSVVVHMAGIGLPIALCARRALAPAA